MTKSKRESLRASPGERMIEIKVRFWTNKLARGEGQIRPKHAWASGVVRMESNKSHGIRPKNPIPFNSLMHLPSVIEKVLINHSIVLHFDNRMRRYFAPQR